MRSTVAFLQSTWSGMHGGGVLIEPFMVHAFPSGWGFRIGVPGMRSRNAKRNAELCVSRAFPFRVPRSVNLASQSPSNTLLPGAGLRRQFVSIPFSPKF